MGTIDIIFAAAIATVIVVVFIWVFIYPHDIENEPQSIITSPTKEDDNEKHFNNVLNGLKYAIEDLINHKSFDSVQALEDAYDWLLKVKSKII